MISKANICVHKIHSGKWLAMTKIGKKFLAKWKHVILSGQIFTAEFATLWYKDYFGKITN